MKHVQIGCNAPERASMFSRRTGFGDFSHTLPPFSADEERLQASYLSDRSFPPVRRDWGAWVVVASLAGLFLIVTSKHWL